MLSGTRRRMPKVEILAPHGFCSGVKAAIETALRVLAVSGAEVYCLHELVHNEAVVADLKARGMHFVDDLVEIPQGATVLFSAHGVGPSIRREAIRRGLTTIDATCPFVARVHRQVRDYAARGMPVAVIGHSEHVEVRGVVDEARDAGAQVAVVAGPEDVPDLAFPTGARIGVVSQTTLSSDAVSRVLGELRARYRDVETTPASEACMATRDRQEAVKAFAARGGDGVLVLGSAKSSNTRRLAELAESGGARAWRVATLEELAASDFTGVSVLGVTSGASTPESFFVQSVEHLSKRFGTLAARLPSVV